MSGKRCALYLRVSDQKQVDGSSLGTQEADCRKYAEKQGWMVTEVFVEPGYSGDDFDRPGLTRLREAIRRREMEIVLVWKLDRFSREPWQQELVIAEAKAVGVEVDSSLEDIRDTFEGEIVRSVLGLIAKQEKRNIVLRTNRARQARAESGKLIPGPKPLYGYRWRDDGHCAYEIDPVAGQIVRRIYAESASGKPLRRIALDLMQDRIPSPTGNDVWRPQTLALVLHNPNYTGRARAWWRRTSTTNAERFNVEKAMDLPEGTIPPLIDEVTWHAVQERLTRNKEQSTRNNRNPEGALLRAGFVRCGHCGHAAVAITSRDVVKYRCGWNSPQVQPCQFEMRAHILDAAVWERVESILTRPEIVARELDRLRTDDVTAVDLAAVDRTLAQVERQLVNLTRAISKLTNADARERLVARLDQESAQKTRLLQEREGILRRREAWQAAEEQLGSLTEWCRMVAAKLGQLTYEEKRLALEALGVQVVVYRADHDPRWEITASIPLDSAILSTTTR